MTSWRPSSAACAWRISSRVMDASSGVVSRACIHATMSVCFTSPDDAGVSGDSSRSDAESGDEITWEPVPLREVGPQFQQMRARVVGLSQGWQLMSK